MTASMGLYDVVLGDGHQAERGVLLLAMLGDPGVARFRDAWVEKGDDGQPVIAIYTRQGGGNRECFCESRNGTVVAEQHVPSGCYAACNEALTRHPLYIRDADDDFDGTYATFYFRVPDAVPADVLARLTEAASEPVNMSERWQEAIDRVGSGELRPAEIAMADQFAAFLSDPDPGDGPRIMQV
jgi:hypothetical protein